MPSISNTTCPTFGKESKTVILALTVAFVLYTRASVTNLQAQEFAFHHYDGWSGLGGHYENWNRIRFADYRAAVDQEMHPGLFRFVNGELSVMRRQPAEPMDDPQNDEPETPTTPPDMPSSGALANITIGNISNSLGRTDQSSLPADRQQSISNVGASDAILGGEAQVRNTADTTDLLANSFSSTGVYRHSRNPISNDLRIRAFHFTQIRGYVNGAYLSPMRADFDTPLSRIDSSIIRDVIVMKGPYSVRHGPGFAFVDVELYDTPRNQAWRGRSSIGFETNGEQFSGRQTYSIGGSQYGMRISYGHRTGVDYYRGDGEPVPATFNARDWDFAYGFDPTQNSSVEFSYQRIDQTSVDLPAQYFFADSIYGDSVALRYSLSDQPFFDRLKVDGWWNRSQMNGSPSSNGVGGISPADNGNVSEIRSTGGRASMTWGEDGTVQTTIGTDYHFIDQESDETARTFNTFGLPRSVVTDAGVFGDLDVQLTCCLSMKLGGRVDWVSSDLIRESSTNNGPAMEDDMRIYTNDGQRYFLGAGYLTMEYQVNCCYKITGGVGYAERPPSPTDLYAHTFMSLLQPGVQDFDGALLTGQVLDKEQLTQFDIGLEFDFWSVVGGVNFFYGWIDDFITYELDPTDDPFTTLSEAEFGGGEFFTEVYVTPLMTAFGSLSYVRGADKSLFRGQPLWSIPPLESTVGLRFAPEGDNPRWSVEFASRIVSSQNRAATYLDEEVTPGFSTFDFRGFWQYNNYVTFIGGVENFGNRNYQEHLDSRELYRGSAFAVSTTGVFRPGASYYLGMIANY